MKAINRICAAFCLVVTLGGAGACTNPETPAGHEGYLYYVPLVFGQMEYRSFQRGAATAGVSWRLFVENIDMQARSYPEVFSLLTRDNLSVSFEVDTRIQLRAGSVKEVVEEWGGVEWYAWNVKEPLRTTVRDAVSDVSATDIQLKTQAVKATIQSALEEKYKDSPIDILSVDIGEIQFPTAVTNAIERKIAKEEELKRQEYVLAKTRKEAAIHVLGALRKAKQQQIIGSTLDPLYVQQKAVEVYRKLGESKNRTVIMLPTMGKATGMPLVLKEGRRKVLTVDDRNLLSEMESKYMAIAGAAVPVPEQELGDAATPASGESAEPAGNDPGTTPAAPAPKPTEQPATGSPPAPPAPQQ